MAKILIIDRHANVREFLAEKLARPGHLVAATGRVALLGELLLTLEPDLVLLDFHLKSMNRWKALEKLKRSRQFSILTYVSENNGGKRKIRLAILNGGESRSFSLETLKKKVLCCGKPK